MHSRDTTLEETDCFIKQFMPPAQFSLQPAFTLPLPDIPGLYKQGEFIVQGHAQNTFSTNIITTHESASLRLVEVYKNTEDLHSGRFVRLVGTLSLVHKGYPFLFLDAAVSNISPLSAQQEPLSTRVAIHLPQAENRWRSTFFKALSEAAQCSGISYTVKELGALPGFWGPLWSAHVPGLALPMIETLRGNAWSSYRSCCEHFEENPEFDYLPTRQQMVFSHAAAEHRLFRQMGLAVDPEAQAAFFSILSFIQ